MNMGVSRVTPEEETKHFFEVSLDGEVDCAEADYKNGERHTCFMKKDGKRTACVYIQTLASNNIFGYKGTVTAKTP